MTTQFRVALHGGSSISTRQVAHKQAWNWSGVLSMLVMLAGLAVWSTEASAYEQYHPSDSTNTPDGCYQCHGFAGATNPTVGTSFEDATRFQNDGFDGRGPLHDMHVGQITGTCNLCHISTGDVPFTYTSGDPQGQGCRGCHGVDNGTLVNWGAGLRAHHAKAGAPADQTGLLCASCHSADPAPSPESTVPVYYARSDVNAKDPCNADGTEDWGSLSPFDPTLPDGLGLDNDGDLVYDGADSDCAANEPPVAVDDAYATDEETPLNVAAPGVLGNDSDADGDALTAVLDTTTSKGTLTLNADGSFSYTPNLNFNGTDSFSYHANDGQADSNVVTVSLTVNDVNDPPVADPNGPYTGDEGVPVTFDGSGSFDVDGTIVAYDWDFGDGGTGTGVSPSHTYAAAGTYTVTVTVTDDDGASDSDSSTADIEQSAAIDLDIAQFRVTKQIRLAKVKPVEITMVVMNGGDINSQTRPATVIGVRGSVELYNRTVAVSDAVGDGRTRFDFPAYTPTAPGDIVWTATIADDDPDVDVASAVTTVR
jgi:VCBS repeat-containing protein